MVIDFSSSEFQEIFGCTFSEFKKQYDDIYQAGENPRVDAFKRWVMRKKKLDFLHPTWDILNKYYMSDEFSYLLTRGKRGVDDTSLDRFEVNSILHLIPKKEYSGTKVLNYGCGSYFAPLILRNFGFEVTMADIPHKYFQFLKRIIPRIESQESGNLPTKFLDIASDICLIENYDFVLCAEVLEHVLEPLSVLEELVSHLKPNRFIFLSTFFDDMRGQDPSHLRQNTERYNKEEIWYPLVNSKGLECILYDKGGAPRIWRKISI